MRTSRDKLRNFAIYYVALQAIPIVLYGAITTLTASPVNVIASPGWTASFLLASLAWLSLPNYLSDHPWSLELRNRFRWLATGVGAALILGTVTVSVFASLVRTAEEETGATLLPLMIRNASIREILGDVSQPIVAVLTLVLLLGTALLYLWISHNRLLRRVSLRLLWRHQAQFVGFYSAQRRGFYEARGVHVSFEDVDPSGQPRTDFFPTASNFAVLSAPDVIKARAEGFRVRSLAILMHDKNIVFFAHSDSGIHSAADFVGRKVGVRMGYEEYPILLAMLEAAGVDPAEVEIQEVGDDMRPFLKREFDVWGGHVACEPNEAIMNGARIHQISPTDHGVRMSGDTLVTTDYMITAEPDVVRAFVDATREGWEFARNNQQAAFQDVIAFTGELAPKQEHYQREMQLEMIALVFREGQFPTRQTEAAWREMVDLAVKYRLIGKRIDPQELIW